MFVNGPFVHQMFFFLCFSKRLGVKSCIFVIFSKYVHFHVDDDIINHNPHPICIRKNVCILFGLGAVKLAASTTKSRTFTNFDVT